MKYYFDLGSMIKVIWNLMGPVMMAWMVKLLHKQQIIKDANSEGTKCLLRVKLIEYHDKYMEEGLIPSYALTNWVEMYHAYKNLGGNGVIERMNQEIETLNIKNMED